MPILIPEALTIVSTAALVLALAALVAAVVALRRARQLQAHYTTLMTGVDGQDVAAALASYVGRLAATEERLAAVEDHGGRVDRRLRRAVQRVRLLRYRAFEEAGGDQSFAVALLDDAADGVVLSSLYGHGGVRIYAKPVAGGRSTYALTTEEERVIREASSGPDEG